MPLKTNENSLCTLSGFDRDAPTFSAVISSDARLEIHCDFASRRKISIYFEDVIAYCVGSESDRINRWNGNFPQSGIYIDESDFFGNYIRQQNLDDFSLPKSLSFVVIGFDSVIDVYSFDRPKIVEHASAKVGRPGGGEISE